jgi:hypothetical protein
MTLVRRYVCRAKVHAWHVTVVHFHSVMHADDKYTYRLETCMYICRYGIGN